MSYLAFALKYRPKDFNEVIGQLHVVTSLKNAILQNRVHHAYLFSGPRGVGKTSVARILAKSLNCFQGPTPNPCGQCPSCIEISKSQSLDIIEIDGASNRGIDEIRTLRENVKLSTAHSRYKIYIIDEVHMLTQEASNALLKTLEEPPSHVKFIFATTHPHKLLPTILSRCQKFQFNLIPLEEVVAKLKKIIELEKIEIKDNLLYTIGRAAEGSIRDAESLLDQLVPVILEKSSLKDIFSFLGIIDEETLNSSLKSLIEKDLTSCLNFVDRMVRDGKDLGIFLNAFIEHLRNLLLAKISIKNFKELSDISPESKDFICELSKQVSTPDILRIIDLLIEAKELSYRLNTARIPLELALIKYSYKVEPEEVKPEVSFSRQTESRINEPTRVEENPPEPDISKIDELNREIDNMDFDAEDEVSVNENKDRDEDKEQDKNTDTDKDVLEPVSGDNILAQAVRTKWKELISYMKKTRVALATHLSFAWPLSSKGRLLVMAFSQADCFHKETIESNKNVEAIEKIISNFMSRSVGVKFVIRDLPPEAAKSKPPEPKEVKEEREAPREKKEDVKKDLGEDEGFLNELLDAFGGKFQSDA